MEQQYSLMKFDPATGSEQPYPSHAKQWRTWHGQTAWLVNPWTGDKRRAEDVGSDPFGHLILPPGEPLLADTSTATVEVKEESHLWARIAELEVCIRQMCNNALDLGYCDMRDCTGCKTFKCVGARWTLN